MNVETINREAADTSKGFRLQKIRAIKLMFDTINKGINSIFFTAIENVEDVSHRIIENGQQIDYYEEDKNYSLDGSFTIFSPPVINTLVSFFDIFVEGYRSSNSVYLGFYTTRAIGKERKKTLKNGEELTLPKDSVLFLLNSAEPIANALAQAIKSILVEEYERQYVGKKTDGNLKTLKEQSIDDFKLFLSKISWSFGQEDEVALKDTVIQLIKNSPLHNVSHANKENIIFTLLMEKLDEKQNHKNLYEKFVNSSDVKLIFKEAESEESELSMDPTWSEIEKLKSELTDMRNLEEKFKSVISDYPNKKLEHLARKACRSKIEESDSNKTFLSLKYRVLEACNDYFFEINYKEPADQDELDQVIRGLFQSSIDSIKELKKDYSYTLSNEKLIEGVVLDLFDSCFLAFDEVENEQ